MPFKLFSQTNRKKKLSKIFTKFFSQIKEVRKPQPSEATQVAENFNKDEMQTSQCTRVGDNGEIITVSITTEESHQASVLGKSSTHLARCVNRTSTPPVIILVKYYSRIKVLYISK